MRHRLAVMLFLAAGPDVGGDDTLDSDFHSATARTSAIAFTAPGVVAHIDAGLQEIFF